MASITFLRQLEDHIKLMIVKKKKYRILKGKDLIWLLFKISKPMGRVKKATKQRNLGIS
jgi:hypothetical protein